MKFLRKKIQGLMNIEVHYTSDKLVPGEDVPFEIVATVEGISFRGRSSWIEGAGALQALAKTIGAACTDVVSLKKGLIATPPTLN